MTFRNAKLGLFVITKCQLESRDLVLQLQIMISVAIFRSNVCCLTVFTSEIYGFRHIVQYR